MPVQTRPRKQQTRRQPVMEVDMEKKDHGVAGVIETPRLRKVEFDENDEKIISATLKAFESGSLTPLIKEELRCTIQSRRLAEGKGEMKVEFKTPVRKKEMDDDERRRALKRRQQNREAAQRFRQKQKDTSDYLTAKIRRLQKSADSLTEHMAKLREEKELLGQMLRDHLSVCSNPQHIQSDPAVNFNNIPNSTHNNSYTEADIAISHAQTLLSQSSVDSTLTCEFTPNTAASDTSSVFFPDSNDPNNFENYDGYESYTPPPQPDESNLNVTHESDNFDMEFSPLPPSATPVTHIDHLNKYSTTNTLTTISQTLDSTSPENNIIVYDGPLDACYEEIIIDFSNGNAEFLRNDGRTRGDSCSSVDTVSSMYSPSTSGSELTPINETTTDVVVPQLGTHTFTYKGSIDFSTMSAYSGIHNIIDAASFNPVSCGKTIGVNEDFLLHEDVGI